MLNKYYKYLPWLILGAIGSYQSATYYARTAFDIFYLTTIFWLFISLCYFYMRTISSIDTKTSLLTCWVILRKIAIPKTVATANQTNKGK